MDERTIRERPKKEKHNNNNSINTNQKKAVAVATALEKMADMVWPVSEGERQEERMRRGRGGDSQH